VTREGGREGGRERGEFSSNLAQNCYYKTHRGKRSMTETYSYQLHTIHNQFSQKMSLGFYRIKPYQIGICIKP
jgi:hypothetical protein